VFSGVQCNCGDKLTLVQWCQVFSGVQCNCGDKLTLVQWCQVFSGAQCNCGDKLTLLQWCQVFSVVRCKSAHQLTCSGARVYSGTICVQCSAAQSLSYRALELYLHSSIYLHGLVLNDRGTHYLLCYYKDV